MHQPVFRAILRYHLLPASALEHPFTLHHLACRAIVLWLLAISPLRLAAAPGDENWDERFLIPGGSAGWPLAVSGTNLYAAGGFSFTNGTQRIARWNGRSWSPLGAGITNATISAIAINGNDVYVGGVFTNAGGLTVSQIAKWDGSSWSGLGGGVTNSLDAQQSQVYAIVVDGGNVYVGGKFTSAGGVNATNIARWDGTSWSSLDSGLARQDNTGYVLALAMDGRNLYAGGRFMIAGGIGATNIAKWDGASWSPLGAGAGQATGFSSSDFDRVYALAAGNGLLYAGGGFATAGGVIVSNIAKWDGSSWSGLSGGGISAIGQVESLAIDGADLYVGGSFQNAGEVTANGLAKWNGSWSTLGTGTPSNAHVYSVAVSGRDVYIGGGISPVGGVAAGNIAKWDGANWSAFGQGLDNFVNAVAVNGSNVFVGGGFSMASGLGMTNIARWNGAAWSALGPGVNGQVRALAALDTYLYVGGDFTQAGDQTVNHIAKWDGKTWSALGAGVGAGIRALAVGGQDVYVGGFFATAGGADIANIARWDGVGWSALGSGVSPSGVSGEVSAIAVSGSDVYVGGGFSAAGGVPIPSGLARWDGNSWSAVGSPTDINPSGVSAIAVHGTDVYISGGFSRIGKLNVNRIAKWDGTSWSALGAGLTDFAASMEFIGSALYVTGSFASAGGTNANHIAKWTGSNWLPLGSGLAGAGRALAVGGTDLYVGGSFTKAGILPAYNFAIWHEPEPQLQATLVALSGGGYLITWSSQPGEKFQVFSTTNLSKAFSPLSAVLPSSGATTSYTDTSVGDAQRYYEIEQVP